ncbi:molybdopterin-dependent oxidoreductase [Alphaproteobacteria bacterium KMM 3653]|uniref:Molybdopterin-dependent oxidoreductase n=1 Tax=Harenicola maris TaxID=2841044 RepID=A0AAP2G9G9_9RHOB|nr:molybdopterin-dependent oxidoreductase [Harenicola maris]
MHIKSLLAACLLAVLPGLPAWAQGLDAPTGRVLLEVSGEIAATNDAAGALFDEAMLRALDWQEVETHTSFTTGLQKFAGPSLSAVLGAVGAEGVTLKATAVNDYFVEIPVSHAQEHSVILAMEMNGEKMRLRDKGPIWVVYPQSEEEVPFKRFDNEMIWQLNRLHIQN